MLARGDLLGFTSTCYTFQASAPGGYVTDAFERLVNRIDEVEDRLNARMDSMDGKLDAILQNITGLGTS